MWVFGNKKVGVTMIINYAKIEQILVSKNKIMVKRVHKAWKGSTWV